MSIVMRALKDFRGRPGEGNTRHDHRVVVVGPEFKVHTKSRADDLEGRGLAIPVNAVLPEIKPETNLLNPAASQNKAASAGPLASPGGETGAQTAPSSSDQVRPPRQRRSRSRAVEPDLLPSTNPGD